MTDIMKLKIRTEKVNIQTADPRKMNNAIKAILAFLFFLCFADMPYGFNEFYNIVLSNSIFDKALGAATPIKDIFEKQGLTTTYIINEK